MKRPVLSLVASALLLGGVGQAGADFTIVTDPMAIVSNDTAPWVRTSSDSNSYSTTSGLGTFSWSFSTDADPFYGSNVKVSTIDGTLFVGTTSNGPGTASYVVNASVDYGGQFVITGLGFYLDSVSPATQLTVYDVQGDSQTFTLDSPGFVGIESNVPLSGFQFAESIPYSSPDAEAVIEMAPVNFEVSPVPAPSGLILTLTGILCIGGYGWRRRNQPVA
jgi:hypothetical protein